MSRTATRVRIRSTLADWGVTEDVVARRRLPIHAEARSLAFAGLGADGRDKFLAPRAARAWQAMHAAAQADGVELLLLSAFRSYDFQMQLIRGKLAQGRAIDEVLTVNAPPGCSEHHSGRAVDIGASGTPPLEEAFERSAAFAWLSAHAGRFGFWLSYPRGNAEGYLYEPWHWCWHPARDLT
ncbi:MAG: D-alanyl-D-alanine carboxypeptidase family [Nevskia sp.]|nr:D-alanyl-D-alanine carboxypeptidase family [Nevskia sp.]